MSDPKLKDARAQITKLCKRLDIACHVILHNAPGEIESFWHVAPNYSKVRIEVSENGDAEVRLKSTLSEYGGDLAAQQRDLAATANMVSSFGEVLGNAGLLFLEASLYVDKQIGAEHGELEKTEPLHGRKLQ